jgi:hypothetical protein
MTAKPNTALPRPSRPTTHLVRAASLFSATALLLSPCLHAQSEAPKPAPADKAQTGPAKLYSMKFSGGGVEDLEKELKAAFPKDNVVVSGTSKLMEMPNLGDFEVRDVQLKELGRTIEFLSDSKLIVEVTEGENGATGNTWRIGNRLANTPPSLFKLQMRSVAAPYLFKDKDNAPRVKQAAETLEEGRLDRIMETTRAGYNDIIGGARVEMLPDQHLFVIVGSEDGIAGIESFIKAAEQLAMEEATKIEALAATIAPKMRAVPAPHLFNNEARLKRVKEECDNAQEVWVLSYLDLLARVGADDERSGVCGIRVQPRPDQKLFMLIGLEDGIAGLETLILAAEKNAADEDAALTAEKAKIEDLQQQLDLAERSLDNERIVMERRQQELAVEKEAITDDLEQLRLRDAKDLSPEKRAHLIAEKNAAIKNIDRILAEGASKSMAQMDQWAQVILETRVRLETAQSKAKK